MAKKRKAKISKVKRNNQTTNKMKKQGKLNLQRHQTKVQKQRQPSAPEPEYSSDSDSNEGEEWADMLDDEEQQYILSRLAKDPSLLSSVPENDDENNRHTKKRKHNRNKLEKRKPAPSDSGADTDISEGSDIEDKYEKEVADRPAKKMRPLLPIKTKQGVLEREEECEESASENELTPQSESKSDSDSGVEGTEEGSEEADPTGDGEVISAVQLLAARRDTLQKEKLRIGALCSSLLESPEKKLKNFYPILYLMEEKLKDGTPNLHSVRKLATLSAFEVFKDILPDYQIRHQDYSNVKLKKDTLALYKYEKELLEFYKRYLQRLEKATSVLRQRRGDNRKLSDSTTSLATVSLQCMCWLLTARPNFNYAKNISQSVIPLLGSKSSGIVAAACEQLFKEDKKGDATLVVVRLINQLVKRRGDRLPSTALDCLLSLRLRDIELDQQTDIKQKLKRDEKHKKRIVNLSKKEKKRNKKLKEVEKELLETQAQESASVHRATMTEVTHCVFHIYFRLLKTAPRSGLLAAVLNGLVKFSHVINLEYYSELVAILQRAISEQAVAPRSAVLCARAALAVLAGAGPAVDTDPAVFHAYLYAHMMEISSASNHEDARIILEALTDVCARARRVSSAVLQAFAKRLATFGLQLHHNGTLGALVLLYQLATQSKSVCSLLEVSDSVGSGRFDPSLPSPEHCNAHATSLFELTLLRRHYHPTTRAAAVDLLKVPPAVPRELAKLSPTQVFQQYDGSQLAFKPSIPPPKKTVTPRKYQNQHIWSQDSLKELCLSVENSVSTNVDFHVPTKKMRKK